MSPKGWIRFDRKVQEHWLWSTDKPFDIRSAWIDLLLSANHKANKFPLGTEMIMVERGSFITSERKLAEKWGWSNTRVRNFLKLLASDGMIIKITDNKKSTITIVNYSAYQDIESTEESKEKHEKCSEEAEEKQSESTEEAQEHTNNNDITMTNNVNNENKNNYSCAFESFWKVYPRKVNKVAAYRCWKTRLKEGHKETDLIMASECYAVEVKSNGTNEKYIKHAATFIGPDKPFTDYIKDKSQNKTESAPMQEEVVEEKEELPPGVVLLPDGTRDWSAVTADRS